MLVSKPTHGGGAPLGIDLDAGVAKIKLTRPAAPAAEPADQAAAEQPGDEPAADGTAAPEPATGPARLQQEETGPRSETDPS